MASLFAKMCPGSYDGLEIAARALLHAQMGCALLGTLGWQGTGYCAGVVAMSALGIAALETQNKALLKYTAMSYWWTFWLDMIWLIVWAERNTKATSYPKYEVRGNELAAGMVVLSFLLKFPQFLIWQKLWHLGFKTTGNAQGPSRYVDFATNPVARGQEMGAPPPQSPGASAFSQPPRATTPSSPAPVVRSPSPVVASPGPLAPVPAAPSPPAPISAPAVVSFTPSGPSGPNNV